MPHILLSAAQRIASRCDGFVTSGVRLRRHGGLAQRGDALDVALGVVQEAVLVGDHAQAGADAQQLAGLQQEVGPGGLADAGVAVREGLVDQQAAGRQGAAGSYSNVRVPVASAIARGCPSRVYPPAS